MTVTLEDLDNTVRKINVLTEALRSQLFKNGKPDWMSQEQWAEIAMGGNRSRSNPMNYDYREGQADLIQAFRLRSNRRIKEIRAFKVTTTEASLMKQGALITWREARKVLSELVTKKER